MVWMATVLSQLRGRTPQWLVRLSTLLAKSGKSTQYT